MRCKLLFAAEDVLECSEILLSPEIIDLQSLAGRTVETERGEGDEGSYGVVFHIEHTEQEIAV